MVKLYKKYQYFLIFSYEDLIWISKIKSKTHKEFIFFSSYLNILDTYLIRKDYKKQKSNFVK